MAQSITSANFSELVASGKPVIVDFWAEWCGPCRMVAPIVEKLAEEYADKAIIGKCNVDENDEMTSQFSIRSIPTIIFLKDGKMVDKQVGACSEDVLRQKIEAVL